MTNSGTGTTMWGRSGYQDTTTHKRNWKQLPDSEYESAKKTLEGIQDTLELLKRSNWSQQSIEAWKSSNQQEQTKALNKIKRQDLSKRGFQIRFIDTEYYFDHRVDSLKKNNKDLRHYERLEKDTLSTPSNPSLSEHVKKLAEDGPCILVYGMGHNIVVDGHLKLEIYQNYEQFKEWLGRYEERRARYAKAANKPIDSIKYGHKDNPPHAIFFIEEQQFIVLEKGLNHEGLEESLDRILNEHTQDTDFELIESNLLSLEG